MYSLLLSHFQSLVAIINIISHTSVTSRTVPQFIHKSYSLAVINIICSAVHGTLHHARIIQYFSANYMSKQSRQVVSKVKH